MTSPSVTAEREQNIAFYRFRKSSIDLPNQPVVDRPTTDYCRTQNKEKHRTVNT